MQEYRSLFITIIAIFILTLAGAYFSPTFSEQKTYLELFSLLGALLFIFSALVVFAAIGFRSFALFMAVFLAIVISMFGVLGAFIVVGLTYIAWGSIFAMELLLIDNNVTSAKMWFISRYDFKTFKMEYYAFYPLIGFVYLLLEIIPNILSKESAMGFSPSRVLKEMEELLN